MQVGDTVKVKTEVRRPRREKDLLVGKVVTILFADTPWLATKVGVAWDGIPNGLYHYHENDLEVVSVLDQLAEIN